MRDRAVLGWKETWLTRSVSADGHPYLIFCRKCRKNNRPKYESLPASSAVRIYTEIVAGQVQMSFNEKVREYSGQCATCGAIHIAMLAHVGPMSVNSLLRANRGFGLDGKSGELIYVPAPWEDHWQTAQIMRDAAEATGRNVRSMGKIIIPEEP